MSELREAVAAQLQLDVRRGAAPWPQRRSWLRGHGWQEGGVHCQRCGEKSGPLNSRDTVDFEMLHSLCAVNGQPPAPADDDEGDE